MACFGVGVIAYRYFGGKNSHLSWLLPLLPEDDSVEHYVEPFCGSCAVFLNRRPAPCETINDLNGRVANFFTIARDRNRELRLVLMRTPYAQSELELAREDTDDPLEAARRFIVGLSMSFGQNPKSGFRILSRVPQNSSPPRAWMNTTKDYRAIRARLRYAQILNQDGIDLIERIDSNGAFFYLDPPYLHETRSGEAYENEMTDADHDRLLCVLAKIKGRAALSGYASSKYDMHFRKLGWNRFENEVRSTIGTKKLKRIEVVWMNYDPIAQDLFAGTAE